MALVNFLQGNIIANPMAVQVVIILMTLQVVIIIAIHLDALFSLTNKLALKAILILRISTALVTTPKTAAMTLKTFTKVLSSKIQIYLQKKSSRKHNISSLPLKMKSPDKADK